VAEFDDDSVNAQITKLVQAYEQTAKYSTIIRIFTKAGMDLNVTTRPFRIRIVEQTLRDNPGFKEVWGRNVLVENLSRRPQMQQFGIINAEFLPVSTMPWTFLFSLPYRVCAQIAPFQENRKVHAELYSIRIRELREVGYYLNAYL
jgi:hypothetical protein